MPWFKQQDVDYTKSCR